MGEKFGKDDAARRAGSEHRIEGQAEAAERLQIGGDGAVGLGPVRLHGRDVGRETSADRRAVDDQRFIDLAGDTPGGANIDEDRAAALNHGLDLLRRKRLPLHGSAGALRSRRRPPAGNDDGNAG